MFYPMEMPRATRVAQQCGKEIKSIKAKKEIIHGDDDKHFE